MRWLLPSLVLLLHPPADDEQARAVYAALRKKIETAETLSVDFTAAVTNRFAENQESMTGSIRMKGQDRWAISLQPKDTRRPDLSSAVTLLSDGRRVVAVGRSLDTSDPKDMASAFRRMLPDSFLFV